jgi:protein-serine/threonine kinase
MVPNPSLCLGTTPDTPVLCALFCRCCSLLCCSLRLSSAARSPFDHAFLPLPTWIMNVHVLILHRSPVVSESDHLYTSGLRRIRQQVSGPQGFMIPSRSPSVATSAANSRVNSLSYPTAPSAFGSCEDLARFPSESLHSFSFANQSEDLNNRQNILKRSIEFMRDKLGWGTQSPLIASAKAKMNGHAEEVESMMELLRKAELVSEEKTPMLTGPITGPADVDGNPFEQSFAIRPKQPSSLDTSSRISDVDALSSSPTDHTFSSETSRSTTNDSLSTIGTSPMPNINSRPSFKRTYTDTAPLALETKLYEAMAQPYLAHEQPLSAINAPASMRKSSVHGHTNRYQPPAQAFFTTKPQAPWTIVSANDVACLVFGVTMAEVNKTSIMDFIREERREWLETKLNSRENTSTSFPYPHSHHGTPQPSGVLYQNGKRRTKSDIYFTGAPILKIPEQINERIESKRRNNQSRGVILCGDVVPIQKRNGNTGAATLWVKEKGGNFIWVLEEIPEDLAFIHTCQRDDKVELVQTVEGSLKNIFGDVTFAAPGVQLTTLLPTLPKKEDGAVDFENAALTHQFTVANSNGARIPCGIEPLKDGRGVRVSCFPYMAGIIVLSAATLQVASSNAAVFSALLGHLNPVGLSISDLIPKFDSILKYLTEEEHIHLVDGMIVPEHSFRRANAILCARDNKEAAFSATSVPSGIIARHRDGSEIHIDVQMRVVISENRDEEAIVDEEDEDLDQDPTDNTEMVYALWVSYSRHLHIAATATNPLDPELLRPFTPPRPPSPGQPMTLVVEVGSPGSSTVSPTTISKPLQTIQQSPTPPSSEDELPVITASPARRTVTPTPAKKKKTINDFVTIDEMGKGAYGQVKLARYKRDGGMGQRVVLKYVTKRRILVDTWTRDRRLGTVPLEIHVLDYLGRDGLKHPNIVEMTDFFEDDINYYIEMKPHGIAGMDLFDYIELKADMDEAECRSIFVQVSRALWWLHTKAGVVHRDIKDENIVLDGEGNVKLIDFGSSAYIKNGPFDVFVGTIGKFWGGEGKSGSGEGIHLKTVRNEANRKQITPPPKSSPENPTKEKNKMSGRAEFFCTQSATKRTHSTMSVSYPSPYHRLANVTSAPKSITRL